VDRSPLGDKAGPTAGHQCEASTRPESGTATINKDFDDSPATDTRLCPDYI